MNWPVVAYAPIPATMPIIAIKPLKRSAPEFMFINKKDYNYQDQLNESGIPNVIVFLQNLNRLNNISIRKPLRLNA